MFVAIILACSYPSIKQKQKIPNIIVADEKSWLLKAEYVENNKKYKKIHCKYSLHNCGVIDMKLLIQGSIL